MSAMTPPNVPPPPQFPGAYPFGTPHVPQPPQHGAPYGMTATLLPHQPHPVHGRDVRAATRPSDLRQGFDPRATAALILGLVSLATGAFAGVPAFILGHQARRDEERLRLLYPYLPRRVAGVALAGMLSGALGTILGVALIAGTGGYWYAQRQNRPVYTMRAPTAATPHGPVTSFGAIRVVDLDEDDALPFRDRLRAELKTAHESGHPVIVETVASFCRTCDEIDRALHQDPMQRALAGATVVRVDVETFEEDLRAAGMWQDTVPWFYRLDSNLRPTDAISADEWDENSAENMAKVLGPFAHGTLATRRSPSPLTTSL